MELNIKSVRGYDMSLQIQVVHFKFDMCQIIRYGRYTFGNGCIHTNDIAKCDGFRVFKSLTSYASQQREYQIPT